MLQQEFKGKCCVLSIHLFRHKIKTLHTLLRMISGARYSGVPHNVQVLPFTRLAKPKSVTFNRAYVQDMSKEWTYRSEQPLRIHLLLLLLT